MEWTDFPGIVVSAKAITQVMLLPLQYPAINTHTHAQNYSQPALQFLPFFIQVFLMVQCNKTIGSNSTGPSQGNQEIPVYETWSMCVGGSATGFMKPMANCNK